MDDATVSYGNVNKQSARQSTIRIAINPVIVHRSNGLQNFSESDIGYIIARANAYFKPINYEFFVVDAGVKHIFNDNFYNLKIEDELQLREKNDVDFAINVYFVSTIILPNQDILSGFTSLPSLNKAGNRIVMSYLDRNREDFQSLAEKVFPHELGHYFGLLHTFNDSNSEVITDRELVTRDIGANCATKGDYLCDTPADPYERALSIASLECGVQPPSNIVDALGQRYQPIDGNIMSYQIRCGNFFTPQQYQRMQSAGNIRFSPDAAYTIIQIPNNSITLQMPDKMAFCDDEVVEVQWKSFGFFFPDNVFEFEMSDATGLVFNPIDVVRIGNKAFITIPKNMAPGRNYRFRVSSTNPELVSYVSDHFEILKKGTYSLSLDKSIVDKGETASLTVQFTGSGPWSWELNTGQQVQNEFQRSVTIPVQAAEDQFYSLKSAKGACGLVDKGNNAILLVIAPKLSVISDNNFSFCEKSRVNLTVQGLQSGSRTAYTVRLTGKDSYILNPELSEGKISFNLPSQIKAGESYKLKIIGTAQGDFSEIFPITVLASPPQPFVISPVEACFNQNDLNLQAEGQNLKWYSDPIFGTSQSSIQPNTSREGIFSYYVSQTNSVGCESAKSKIDLVVKAPLIANISGNEEILQGDSTQLRLSVSGEGPVQILLNDGTSLLIDNGTFFYFVKPSDSFTYTIREASNGCGIGVANGQAQVLVQLPLATQETMESLKLFPNPSSNGVLNFESSEKIMKVECYNVLGNRIQLEKRNSNIYFVPENNTKTILLKIFFEDGQVVSKKAILLK